MVKRYDYIILDETSYAVLFPSGKCGILTKRYIKKYYTKMNEKEIKKWKAKNL